MIKPPVETHAAMPVSAQSTGTHPAPGSRKTSSTEGLDCEYGGAGRSHMCRGLEEKELWLLKGLSTGRGQGLCGSLHSCPAIPTPWGMWSEDPCTSDRSETWENGATDTMNPSSNQVWVACLLLSCKTQEKMVLFCLQGETHTGKVKLKCSQCLMIPQKQVLPLQACPVTLHCSGKGPHVRGGLDPRPCSSRGKQAVPGETWGKAAGHGRRGVCEVGLHDIF